MIAVGVMEVAVDEVVDVVSMRHSLVAAIWPMDVIGVVAGTIVVGRAIGGIVGRHVQTMLVDVIAVGVMQVAIVKVVDVTVMNDRGVPASFAMFVIVMLVLGAFFAHFFSLFVGLGSMLESVVEKFDDVRVGKFVVDVSAVPGSANESALMERAQPLRYGRHPHVELRCQLGHAVRAVLKDFQQSQPSRITHRLEHGGASIDHPVGNELMLVRGVVVAITVRSLVIGRHSSASASRSNDSIYHEVL
jgi:hypothetical protein